MPINDILNLSNWRAKQTAALSGDPLEDVRRYGDYLRLSFDSRGELDEDKRNEIDSTLYSYAKQNKLVNEEAPEEEQQTQFFTRPISTTDVKLVRDNLATRKDVDPASLTAFDDYQSLYSSAQSGQPFDQYAFDSAKQKVDSYLTKDEITEARRAAVKRGDLLATTYEDSAGNTQIEVADNASSIDPELLRNSIHNNAGTFDTRALPVLFSKLQQVEGLNVNHFQYERSTDAVSTVEKLAKDNSNLNSSLEKLRNAVTGGFGQKVTELIQFAPNKDEAMNEVVSQLKPMFPTDYSEQEIRNSVDDYTKLTSERSFDPSDPTGSFKQLSTGQFLAPTSLLLDAKKHDQIVDKLKASPEAKQLLKDQRVTQLESLAPEIIKSASEASSKFSDYYAKEKDSGNADTDIINKWFGNKQNYNQFANWAETVGGGALFEGVLGLAAYPLAMAGNSTAREGLIQWQKESAANRQYASYFGADFGLATDILEQVIPIGVDTLIAIGAGSVSAGTGAGAYIGGKALLKAGMRSTLRTALIESGTKALVDESLVKAGLAGLRSGVKQSAVTALEKEGLAVTGQNILRKASEATTRLVTGSTVNVTAFSRSAGGNFLSTYTALKDQTNKDGSPKYTDSEVYSNALTSGLVAGAVTVSIMSAFKWMGAEGTEAMTNRGLSLLQMKKIYDLNRGKLAGLGEQVAGLAPSGARQLVAETFEQTLKSSIRQAANGIIQTAVKNSVGEGIEESLDQTVNSIVDDVMSKRDVNVGRAIDSGLKAGAYGLAFGAAGGIKTIGISDQISASQVGAEAMAAVSNQENTLTAIANKMESTGLTQAAGFIRNRIGETRQTGISMADQIKSIYEKQAAGVQAEPVVGEPTGIAPIDFPTEPTEPLPAEPIVPAEPIAGEPLPVEPTEPLPVEPTEPLPVEPTEPLPVEPTEPPAPVEPPPAAGPELHNKVGTTYGIRNPESVDADELRVATQSRAALESSGQFANAEGSTEFHAKKQATAQTQRAELQQYGLQDGVKAFFENIIRTHPNKSYARLAKTLLNVPNAFEGFTIDVIDAPYEPYAGLFMPKSKRILINAQVDSGRGSVDSSLHEMLHAATEHAIVNPVTAAQKKAVAALDELRQQILVRSRTFDKIKSKQVAIGLNSVSEFVTYTYTHPEFQQLVNEMTPVDSIPYMKRIWGTIAKVITGKSDAPLENALNKIGDLVTLANPRAFDRTLTNAPVVDPATVTRSSIGQDYRISHQPSSEDARLFDLTQNLPEDIYSNKAAQYYGSGNARDKQTFTQLKSFRNNPDADVTIYRVVPESAAGINAGDWVTLSPEAADEMNNSEFLGKDSKGNAIPSKIVEMTVKAKDITWSGDSVDEFGYFPQEAGTLVNAPISIGRATVNPTAQTRTFDGADGSPTVTGPALFSIGAFHGTPHAFERFSTDKIGTGEGAQVQGWGLYFAGRKAVAEIYQKTLSGGEYVPIESIRKFFTTGNIVPSYSGLDRVVSFNEGEQGHWSVTVQAVDEKGEAKYGERPRTHFTRPDVKTIKSAGLPTAIDGNLYTVTLDVEQDELLVLDDYIAEQSQKVRAALAELLPSVYGDNFVYHSGKVAYHALTYHLGSPEAASKALNAAGIKGIKYLDGASRTIGDGTHNLVIFDHSNIKITEANGTPVDLQTSPATATRASVGEDAPLEAGRVPADHTTLAEYAATGGTGIRGMSPATTLQIGDKIEMSHTNITLGRLSRLTAEDNGLLDANYPAGIMPFSLKPAGAGKQNVINARLSNSKVKLENLARTEFVKNAKSFALDRDASIEDVLAAVNGTLNRGKLLGINMTDFKLTNPEIARLETIPAGTVVYAQGAKTVIGGPTGTLESFNEPINVRELDPEEWTAVAYNPALGNYMYPVTRNEDGSLSFDTDQKFVGADEVVMVSDMGKTEGVNFGVYAYNIKTAPAIDELKTADVIKEQLKNVEPTVLTVPEVRASVSADDDTALPDDAIDKAISFQTQASNGESGASLEDQSEQVRELLRPKMSYAGEEAQKSVFLSDSLEAARAMAASGINSEVVRNITGWFAGQYDGKMRWEISDEKYALNVKALKSIKDPAKYKTEAKLTALAKANGSFLLTLDKLIQHEELFEAYPELKDLRVTRVPSKRDPNERVQGWFVDDGATGMINITPYCKNPESTLIHEIQHWIQRKEGFAKGGNDDTVVGKLTDEQVNRGVKAVFDKLDASTTVANDRAIAYAETLKKTQTPEGKQLIAAYQAAYKEYAGDQAAFDKLAADLNDYFYELPLAGIEKAGNFMYSPDYERTVTDRLAVYQKEAADMTSGMATLRMEYLVMKNGETPAAFAKRQRSYLSSDRTKRWMVYQNVAGEIEARDVQARQQMTDLQRKLASPYSAENIAPEFAFNLRASIGEDNQHEIREGFSHNEIARMAFDSVPASFKLQLIERPPTLSKAENASMDDTLMGIEPDQRDTIYINPPAIQKALQNVTPFAARNMVQGMINHELIHIETLNEFSIDEIADIGKRLPEKYKNWLTRQYYGDVKQTGIKDAAIARDVAADQYNELNVGAEFIRRKVEEITYGRSSEYSDGYWKSNPKERERLMSALDRGLTKIRARFNARPDLNTADRIAKVARAFRQEQAGIYGSKPPASLTTDVLAHNEEFQKLLEDGFSDQTNFQLPLMSIGADVDADKFWSRMAEKLTNNLTPEMRVMINDRNAQLSRVAFRIERFDKQFRKMFPKAEESGVSIQDVRDALGSTADTVSIDQRKELEQHMINFTATLSETEPDLDLVEFNERIIAERSAKWRAYRIGNNDALAIKRNAADRSIRDAGHPVFADLLADMRLQIDNESNLIRGKTNLSGHMQLVIEDNMGLYLTRSYQFFSNEAWALAAQGKEAGTLRAADGSVIDFGQLRADAASEFKQQLLEEADAAGIEMTEEELNTKMMDRLDNYLKELMNSSPNIPITMNKLKQDLSSLMPRAGVTEKFRALLGEVDSPLANAAVTLKNVSRIQINDTFDKKMANYLQQAGLASTNSATGVPIFSKSAGTAYGALSGLYADPKIAAALQAEFGVNGRGIQSETDKLLSGAGKALLGLSGLSLTAKTLGSFGFYSRNFVSGIFFFGGMQGIVPNGKLAEAYKIAYNTSFSGKSTSEQAAVIDELIELGLLKDDAQSRSVTDVFRGFVQNADGELDRLVNGINVAINGDHAQAAKLLNLTATAKNSLKTAVDVGAGINDTMDSAIKVQAYFVELETLKKAYANDDSWTETRLKREAAAIVKRTFPTHSQVFPLVRSFNNSTASLFIAPFIRFKAETARVFVNTYKQALTEIKTDNPVIKRRGVRRLVGAVTTTFGTSSALAALYSGIFGALAGDDDEEKGSFAPVTGDAAFALRSALPDWQEGHRLFVKLASGDVSVIDMTSIDAFSIIKDPLMLAMNPDTGDVDPKLVGSYIAKQLVGGQIAAGTALEVLQNKTDRGDVIWDTNTDSAMAVIGKAMKHYYSGALEIGILSKGMDVSEALKASGRAEDEGRVFRASEIILGEILGARPRRLALDDIAYRSMRGAKQSLDNATKNRSVVNSAREMPDDVISKAVADYNNSTDTLQAGLLRRMDGLEALGLDMDTVLAKGRKAGFSKLRLFTALDNTNVRWSPSKEFYSDMAQRLKPEILNTRIDQIEKAVSEHDQETTLR